jgi:hypothetical protein
MLDRLTGWVGGLLGRRRGGGGAASGDTEDQLVAFREALQAVSPDFERYCRMAGEAAAEAATRTVYAGLPAAGKVSRSAVVREFLVRLAEAEGGGEANGDVDTISSLSERQLSIAARRAGIPI